jgi:ribosomal protein S12 methylthiotransferase
MPIRKKEDWYVFVTGCLSERYRPDLEKYQCRSVFGTTELPQLLKALC